MPRLVFACLFILHGSLLWGQYLIETFDKSVLPFTDGLYWIDKSPEGTIRISGKQGIIELSGYNSTSITLKDSTSKINHDQHIQSPLFTDANGKLWTTTPTALHCYNPVSGKTKTTQLSWNGQILEDGYHIIHLNSIKETIWLKAGKNIWEYNFRTTTLRPIADAGPGIYFAASPDLKYIVGTTYRNNFLLFTRDPKDSTVFIKELINIPYQSTATTISPNGQTAWIASNFGLLKLDITNPSKVSTVELLDSVPINHLAIDTNDILWLATIGNGLIGYNSEKNKILCSLDQQEGMLGSNPNFISISAENDVFATFSDRGINVVSQQKRSISSILPGLNEKILDLTLFNNQVFGATRSGKIFSFLDTRPERAVIGDIIEVSPLPTIGKFHHTSTDLWFGFRLGLARLKKSARQQSWSVYPWAPRLTTGFYTTEDDTMFALGRNGIEAITIFPDSINTKHASAFQHFNSEDFSQMVALPNDQLLFAYQDQEIWFCRRIGSNWQIEQRIPLMGSINAIHVWDERKIYVGSSTGLYLINPTGMSQQLLHDLSFFQNRPVESIARDQSGILWLGTQSGLIKYNPKTEETCLFTEADGLPSNDFLNINPINLPDGRIWMATDEGLIEFNPAELSQPPPQSHPILTRIRINEIPHQDSLRPAYLTNLSTTYARNDLDFQIATTELETSPLSSVEYQLVGHDRTTRIAESGQTIVYSNLPHGAYTFSYAAIDRHGTRSASKELHVTIHPPFTQTWPFYLLIAFGTSLLLGGTYIFLLRQERLKQQRLQQQQARLAAERDRIAGEVHDDLGGQLSSIMYLSEELLLTEAVPGTERELQRIHELSRGSLQNVRDIIFALDNRRSDLASLGEQFRGAGTEFFQDRKIAYEYTEEIKDPGFILTSRQKRNLTLVVKEAWHNIAKHAQAEHVSVQLQQSNGSLLIEVADDGRGFSSPKSTSATGGYGLDNMHEKATSIGGTLTIDSAPGDGTRLTLNWPLP